MDANVNKEAVILHAYATAGTKKKQDSKKWENSNIPNFRSQLPHLAIRLTELDN